MCENCLENEFNIEDILELKVNDRVCEKDNDNLLTSAVFEINTLVKRANKTFLKIGAVLQQIRDNKLFAYCKNKCYSFMDFCKNNINLSYKTCCYYIQIVEFIKSPAGEKFENCSYSVLQELVSIDQEKDIELLNSISPASTRAIIRDLKHEYYSKKNVSSKVETVESNISEIAEIKQLAEKSSLPINNKKEEDKKAFFAEIEKAQAVCYSNEIEPLVLKNKEARLEFLKTYQSWELYASLDYLRLKIYRRRLKNKTSIIAFEPSPATELNIHSYLRCRFVIFKEPECRTVNDYPFSSGVLNLFFHSENIIADYLTKYKKEIE